MKGIPTIFQQYAKLRLTRTQKGSGTPKEANIIRMKHLFLSLLLRVCCAEGAFGVNRNSDVGTLISKDEKVEKQNEQSSQSDESDENDESGESDESTNEAEALLRLELELEELLQNHLVQQIQKQEKEEEEQQKTEQQHQLQQQQENQRSHGTRLRRC